MNYPEPIEKFIETFAKLPAIGKRQASRLAFYIFRRKELAQKLEMAIKNIQERIIDCPNCRLPFEKNNALLCPICSDKSRNSNIICLLEKELDAFSFENTGRYKGVYHILGRLIDPSDPKTYESLGLNILEKRISALPEKQAEEIIIAVNPTAEGDLTAMFLERKLKDKAKKITRLGRGMPTGGEIEFADEETLWGALENRR